MGKTMKRFSLTLAALTCAGAVAGCGAADDFNPDVVAQAADKTASAGGAKMSMVEQIQGQTVRATGFVDSRGRTGRMHLQLPGSAGAMDAVFLKSVMYMHFPPAIQDKVADGKAWAKIDLQRVGKKQGIDLQALQSTSSNDPSSQLDQLRGAGNVKKVGTEKVRGTATTHYKATLDLRKAAERAPAAQREAARRSIDNLVKQTGQSTIPVEVWIDKQGRARRMSFDEAIKGTSLKLTMELYDFGTREAVKAPPASETKDLTDLAAKGAGG
jgi:hypothetical protein